MWSYLESSGSLNLWRALRHRLYLRVDSTLRQEGIVLYTNLIWQPANTHSHKKDPKKKKKLGGGSVYCIQQIFMEHWIVRMNAALVRSI